MCLHAWYKSVYNNRELVENFNIVTDVIFSTRIIICALFECDQLAFVVCIFYSKAYCFGHFIERTRVHYT